MRITFQALCLALSSVLFLGCNDGIGSPTINCEGPTKRPVAATDGCSDVSDCADYPVLCDGSMVCRSGICACEVCAQPHVIYCDTQVCTEQQSFCYEQHICPSGFDVALGPDVSGCIKTDFAACGMEVQCCPSSGCAAPIACKTAESCPHGPCTQAVCDGGRCGIIAGFNCD